MVDIYVKFKGYGVNLRTHSKYGKIQTRKYFVLRHNLRSGDDEVHL